MLKEFILNSFTKNQGKIIGSLIGFILAISVLMLGFFRTLVIVIFMAAGYYIGKKVDNKEDLIDLLDRILPSGWNR